MNGTKIIDYVINLSPVLFDSLFFRFFFQGGLSTLDEMCITFVMYYPKVNLTKCTSSEWPAYSSWTGKYVKYALNSRQKILTIRMDLSSVVLYCKITAEASVDRFLSIGASWSPQALGAGLHLRVLCSWPFPSSKNSHFF